MESWHEILEFLRGQPVIVLFMLLGVGYLLGRIHIAGIELGPVAGTLLISLVLGHYGFRISAGAQAVGFALFIFSVGYQAGPHFMQVLKAQGARYFALAIVVVGIGVSIAWLAGKLLHLPLGGNAGLLAGALTSSPTLAAAQEAVRSGLVAVPAGRAAADVVAFIGASYAITYIVGMLGVIAIAGLLPRMIGLDLAEEARRLTANTDSDVNEPLQARAYRVENAEFCRPSLGELSERLWDRMSIVRIRRGLEWLKVAPTEHLRIGDEIYAHGFARFFRAGIERAGPEIRIPAAFEITAGTRHVVVVRKGAIGRTLEQLDLTRTCGVVVCEVKREGRALPVTRDLALQPADVIAVVGPAWGIKALAEILGPVERGAIETDMTTFVFGIAIGAAIGVVSITVAGVPLSLGMAGGLLVVGIAVGWLNTARPTVGRFPEAARWILMEFGLLIFIAGVGLSSGAGIVDTFRETGVALIIAAALAVAAPLSLGYLFGRKVLKLEPVLLLGALTGAMTSTPALGLLTREAQSPAPALGYTGTYALASILLTVAGTVIMRF